MDFPLLLRFTVNLEESHSEVVSNGIQSTLGGHGTYAGGLSQGRIHYHLLATKMARTTLDTLYRSFSFGFMYIQGLLFLLFIDACLTDDEPLWEPVEWSLVQSWLLFIFSFAWIAENLIVSRYGSYTGRDKRV